MTDTDVDEKVDKIFGRPTDKIKEIKENPVIEEDVFSETPMELKKVTENLTFINKIRSKLFKKKGVVIDVFGVDKVDLNDILKINIWDRSILTTDTVSRMFLKMTLEQLKKYIPKKQQKGFDYWWLIILLLVGGIALIVIIFLLLPRLASMKIF